MKATFLTNTTIKDKWLDELAEYVDWDVTVQETEEMIPAKWNPYFKSFWGNFDWLRARTNADINCFVTTQEKLESINITGHIGMYDLVDRNKKHEYYIGLPKKLDSRAQKNGFRSNFTWLVIHEYLHGVESSTGSPDRVHSMEEQGRLLELLEEHIERRGLFVILRETASKYLGLLKKKPKPKNRPEPMGNTVDSLLPLVERQANKIVHEMHRLGEPVRIVEGYRSPERQQELYNQGRTTPGNIVTNAKPGESLHQYGCAVDFVFRKEGYNANEEQWELLGITGEKNGFDWGGRWTSFTDKPHFQMTLGYTLNDYQQGRVDYSKFQ